MLWKKFLIASTISLMVAFPQNLIGCAGGEDPYDYFTSFYWNEQVDPKGYESFYYTGMAKWYVDTDFVSMNDVNIQSWKQYFDNKPPVADVDSFIYKFSYRQLLDLYNSVEKNTAYAAARKNEVAEWFLTSKDVEALGYIMYAKQVEPHVTGSWDAWEPIKRDSVKMSGLIRNGLQLYKAAKKEGIKLRFAYQLMRLAHYSKRYDDCINFYNLYVKSNTATVFLKPLCLAHKAGAFFRKGESDSATYLFSLAFAQTDLKRLSNMLGFEWSHVDSVGRDHYLSLCKNNTEKANMLGMFALQSVSNGADGIKDEIDELNMIALLDPSSPLLEIITAREINKIEEFYFTTGTSSDKIKQLETLLLSFTSNRKIAHSGFYMLAAAHLAFIRHDFVASEASLAKAKEMQLNAKQNDQWNLTKLLVTINKQQTFDASFEGTLLPSLKWLESKGEQNETWRKFYREMFVDVLAGRYHKQSDIAREALCYAVASPPWGGYDFLRERMNSSDLLVLNSLMSSQKRTAFEDYMVSKSSFNVNDVKDVIATSFIRENNWLKAEEWLKKIPASYYNNESYKIYLAANSFADLLLDTHAPTKQDTVKYTKLKFVQKMMQLEKQLTTAIDNNKKAKIHYQLANGYYQMSYWGNSWLLQAYDWSGSEVGDYAEPINTEWQKEYYGVHKAEENYKKAFELSADPEFKARCLFMASKCSQKQFNLDEGNEENISKYQKANTYFPQIIRNYKTTAFYKQAYNTCSYFSDFVKKNK